MFAIGVTLLVHRPNIGLINSVTLAISSVSTTIKWKCSGWQPPSITYSIPSSLHRSGQVGTGVNLPGFPIPQSSGVWC